MTLLSATNPGDSERGVDSEEQEAAPPISNKSAEENEAEPSMPTPASSEVVVPPEEKLTSPLPQLSAEEIQTEEAGRSALWLVVAKNKRVNREWEALLLRAPENARRCYEDLCNAPMVRKPGRVFPLKGKHYRGAWEYEVTKGERGFYVPDEEKRKVLVYYAGSHIKPAPPPP